MFQGQPEILAELIFSVCSLAFCFSHYEIHPHFLIVMILPKLSSIHSQFTGSFKLWVFYFLPPCVAQTAVGLGSQAIQTGDLSRASSVFKLTLSESAHFYSLSGLSVDLFSGLCIVCFISGLDSEFIAVIRGRIISLRICMFLRSITWVSVFEILILQNCWVSRRKGPVIVSKRSKKVGKYFQSCIFYWIQSIYYFPAL